MVRGSTSSSLIGSQHAAFRASGMMDIWRKPIASGHSA
jgi:hypothetical protein